MEHKKLITTTLIADRSNYGSERKLSSIKYIVIHYTGNDGDKAINNLKYFSGKGRKASAHFFVDDKDIGLSVDVKFSAWHCGGKLYGDVKTTGGGKMYGKCNNNNSIGIEICDTVKDGKYAMSKKTEANVKKIVKALMKDFNIPTENLIRHFDVSGKRCPAYMCVSKENEARWKEFKSSLTGEENKNEPTKEDGTKHFLVKIEAETLNIRSGPSVRHDILGEVKRGGVYTIIETQGDWGRLKSKKGWINLKYTKR